jgi:hypothetical protein
VRRFFISAALLLLSPFAIAQRGGGHGSGGQAGFVAGGPRMGSRGRSSSGFRIERGGSGRFLSRSGGLLVHDRFHRGFRRRYTYPGVYGGYYADPWLYDDYGDSGDDRSGYNDPGSRDDPNRLLLQGEIDRLQDQVSGLRAQRDALRSSATQANDGSESAPGEQAQSETVLVFRDRHTEQVQNYAIIGKMIWVFKQTRKTKIPLADLDIPATTKLNEDRGVDFRVPG